MTFRALYVSLGHNSSAVYAEDNRVIRAYEQERLDRKKSSSAYPRDAIEACLRGGPGVDVAYVSHWFDDRPLESNKYLDLSHLRSVSDSVETLGAGRSHHDVHAQSAVSFFRANDAYINAADVIVLDGFGTNQECFSVYRDRAGQSLSLTHRVYGYEHSLGLMYQYATEYLGLKPNQDEYKLLGYEAHIKEHAGAFEISRAMNGVINDAEDHVQAMLKSFDRRKSTSTLIDYNALAMAKVKWTRTVDAWGQLFKSTSIEGKRARIAFCAQTFLEHCVTRLIDLTVAKGDDAPFVPLILAGGCHYNVKLNRRIQTETGRNVMSHPLAGDQGAAMGFTPNLRCVGLTLGDRDLGRRTQVPIGVEICEPGSWIGRAMDLLHQDRIVNVVRGGMEYGPRALCNTSTLALPTWENVARINLLNERDDAMPMAPVMTRSAAMAWLRREEVIDVRPSDRFMITTCAFNRKPPPQLMGVAHKDPVRDLWTARPQVVDSGSMHHLLQTMVDETLINTSFNYHGEPIVFTEDDACRTHEMQSFRAKTLGIEPPITLIARNVK